MAKDILVPVRTLQTVEPEDEGVWLILDDSGCVTLTTFPPNSTPEETEIWASVPTFEV